MPQSSRRKLSRWIVIALAAAAWAAVPCGAGERLVAAVQEPFEFDGHLYEGGTVSVKVLRAYTPGSLIAEVWVDELRVGMMRSRTAPGSSAVERSYLSFERDGDGRLVLTGYALRGIDGAQRFRPASLQRPMRESASSRTDDALTACLLPRR